MSEDFEQIVKDYNRTVWNFAFSLTRRTDLSDDITQDVFIKVYQRLDSLRKESSIKTWLLSITRHVAFNYQRTSFLRRVTLVEFIPELGSQASAEDSSIDKIVTSEVWKMVLQLPLKLREVMVLSAHYQLSTAEMAALLNVSEGTVRTRIHRARRKMTQLIKEAQLDGPIPI